MQTLEELAKWHEAKADGVRVWAKGGGKRKADHTAAAATIRAAMAALHEIDIIASNTIAPDGKDAAFCALDQILRLLLPFRAALNQKGPRDAG